MLNQYALFDIRIRGAGPARYTVEVHSELGGDANSDFTPPSNDPVYQQLAERLQRLEIDEDQLSDLGRLLFQSLFQGKIKEIYTRAQGRLQDQQGQRLRFDIDPALAELTKLPWEFLYDPDQGPLALLDAPIVRYLAQQAATPILSAQLPIKVLVTSAATPPAPDVERELAEVRAALSELAAQGLVSIQVEEHVTQSMFQRRLREGFQIWHFIGHGGTSRDGRSGTLLFEDGTGSSKDVSAGELNILLNRSGVRLIMLDACGSGTIRTEPYRNIAPALIRAQIPAVIAMQMTVPQNATRAFAGEFYRALAEGFPIDACVTEGRKAVVGATGLRNPDWGIPVVYTRAESGRLFDRPAAQPATLASTPTAPATSGVNVIIGDGSTLKEGSAITIDSVGNTSTIGSNAAQERADQIASLQAIIYQKKRRLQQLKLQAARYGSLSTPPEIANEIEDLEGFKDYRGNLLRPGEIAKLESELKELGG